MPVITGASLETGRMFAGKSRAGEWWLFFPLISFQSLSKWSMDMSLVTVGLWGWGVEGNVLTFLLEKYRLDTWQNHLKDRTKLATKIEKVKPLLLLFCDNIKL